jgi:hopanoid biosynthesis associated protein HpnK
MKRLIVNADDFGMSPAINAGIIRAHRRGIVTSATIVANGASFAEAVRLAAANPQLGVGVHLNLVEGRPVARAGSVSSLVDQTGRFRGASVALAAHHWRGRINRDELVLELEAQISRVIDAGLQPTHVDSHMHTHCLPGIDEAVAAAAARFGIRRVRCAAERVSRPTRDVSPGSWMRSTVVSYLAARSRDRLRARGLRTTDHFVGPRFMGRLDLRRLQAIIEGLPAGTTELMCHPAAAPEPPDRIDRVAELAALTSGRARMIVAARGVELVTFANV